jgi:hypothetical protein
MPNYQNGKIYVIKSAETADVYIGSTCATLKNRLSKHKSAFRTKAKRLGTAVKILKYSDAFIELVENWPCQNKKELLDREGTIIKSTPNCVNTQIQGRTMKQYKIDNFEKLKQQQKAYRENNKEMLDRKYKDWYQSAKGISYRENLKARRNVKVVCPNCEKMYSKSNLRRHIKTKHPSNLN